MKKKPNHMDRLIREANHLLLTPYEQLSKKDQKVWMAGTKRLLKNVAKGDKR